MGKFVVRETKTGIKFDLKAGNGEVIATSEVYSAEKSCLNGIESVRNNCAAAVEDQTVEGFEALGTDERGMILKLLKRAVPTLKNATLKMLLAN